MTQDQADLEAVVAVLREYQHENGHAEVRIRIRAGRVVLIEDTRKRKPKKGNG